LEKVRKNRLGVHGPDGHVGRSLVLDVSSGQDEATAKRFCSTRVSPQSRGQGAAVAYGDGETGHWPKQGLPVVERDEVADRNGASQTSTSQERP